MLLREIRQHLVSVLHQRLLYQPDIRGTESGSQLSTIRWTQCEVIWRKFWVSNFDCCFREIHVSMTTSTRRTDWDKKPQKWVPSRFSVTDNKVSFRIVPWPWAQKSTDLKNTTNMPGRNFTANVQTDNCFDQWWVKTRLVDLFHLSARGGVLRHPMQDPAWHVLGRQTSSGLLSG